MARVGRKRAAKQDADPPSQEAPTPTVHGKKIKNSAQQKSPPPPDPQQLVRAAVEAYLKSKKVVKQAEDASADAHAAAMSRIQSVAADAANAKASAETLRAEQSAALEKRSAHEQNLQTWKNKLAEAAELLEAARARLAVAEEQEANARAAVEAERDIIIAAESAAKDAAQLAEKKEEEALRLTAIVESALHAVQAHTFAPLPQEQIQENVMKEMQHSPIEESLPKKELAAQAGCEQALGGDAGPAEQPAPATVEQGRSAVDEEHQEHTEPMNA